MKKILPFILGILATVIALSSCTKDNPDSTYTVHFNVSSATADAAVKCDVTVFEYTYAGEKVGQNTVDQMTVGTTRKFTANGMAVKVKVYIKMYIPNVSSVSSRWVQQVYYLETGKNIDIALEDSTMLGSREP